MSGELLVKRQNDQTIEAFISSLSTLLSCGPWEERESSNYIDYRYFRCFVLALEVTVAIADDDEFSSYDFQVFLEPEVFQTETGFLARVADCIARKLALHGYLVLRPFDSSRRGRGAISYSVDTSVGSMSWEHVITTEIRPTEGLPPVL